MKSMNITVFGGSQPQPASPAYQEANQLGDLLARHGHTVLTGGYIGAMEAVSRGAAEADGYVVGVTCNEIETWRPVKPNAWIHEERRFSSLQERLHELIFACDAALALPGGPGTMTEIALMWNLMIIRSLPVKPLVLIGPGWRSVMESFFASFETYISIRQREILHFVPDIMTAVTFVSV
jgi:uncharacterized protein (TIGR00730 family)